LNGRAYVDLIIADVLEDLPVPIVSNPSTSIPVWDEMPKNFLESLFDFASEYLQDNGAMILIHGAEIPLLKSKIRSISRVQVYHVQSFVAYQWEGLNEDGKQSKSSFMSKVSFFFPASAA
jgi:hypothetical protein